MTPVVFVYGPAEIVALQKPPAALSKVSTQLAPELLTSGMSCASFKSAFESARMFEPKLPGAVVVKVQDAIRKPLRFGRGRLSRFPAARARTLARRRRR